MIQVNRARSFRSTEVDAECQVEATEVFGYIVDEQLERFIDGRIDEGEVVEVDWTIQDNFEDVMLEPYWAQLILIEAESWRSTRWLILI